jgi:outer membrane protein TolC
MSVPLLRISDILREVKHVFFFAACAIGAALPLAGETLALSLEAATEYALRENTDLAKDALDTRDARRKADHLWAEILSVSAEARAEYELTHSGLQTGGRPGYNLNAAVALDLGLGLHARLKTIRLAYQSRALNYETAQKQLEISVAKSYYALLTQEKHLSLLRDRLKQAEKQREKDKTLFENGLLSALNVQRGLLAAETARFELRRAELDAANNTASFLNALGVAGHTEIELTSAFEIKKLLVDADDLIARLLGQRPDVIQARLALETAELGKKQTFFQSRTPALRLSAGWNGGADLPRLFSNTFRAGLSLVIPIDSWIPYSKPAQSVGTAQSAAEKARLELKNTEKNAVNSIRNLVMNLKTAWESIEIARLRAELAEKTYRLALAAFENGAEEYLALETARNELTLYRWEELREELSYKNTSLELAAALNITLGELEGFARDE